SPLLVLLLALVNIASLAGMVYPFGPFRRRSRAVLTFVASFILASVLVADRDDGSANRGDAEAPSEDGAIQTAAGKQSSVAINEKHPREPVPDDSKTEILDAIQSRSWSTAERL